MSPSLGLDEKFLCPDELLLHSLLAEGTHPR